MIKRLTLAVAGLFALASQVFAAGTVPGFSLTPQFDLTGKVAPGCKLYVIKAGTVSTPQNAYQDSGLTVLAANPLTCDAAGRLPQWFVADGTIKVRLTKSDGTQIFVGDNLSVVGGATTSGGGGGSTDATTVLSTGDVKFRYGTGALSGFVRWNGRTIGSSSSGATERANADCQALFQYLWTTDPNLTVSSGRGVSAGADWAANKTIALPDARSRALAGLSDMGTSNSGLLTSATCSSNTTLGAVCGSETRTILQANFPTLNWPKTLGISNTLAISDPGHFHGPGAGTGYVMAGSGAIQATTSGNFTSSTNTATATTGISITGSVSITGDTQSGGSDTPLGTLPPIMLVTIYMKL